MVWHDHKSLMKRMAMHGFGALVGSFAMLGGHLYRSNKVKGLVFNPVLGGKYNDQSFLCEVCKKGPIAWMLQPQWHYRQHLAQDSEIFDIADAMSILAYYRKTCGLDVNDPNVQQVRKAMFKKWAASQVKRQFIRDIELAVRELVKRDGSIAIFPCGKYVKKILNMMDLSSIRNSIFLVDDNPDAKASLGEWSDRFFTSDYYSILPGNPSAILAVDSPKLIVKIKDRANEIFGSKWIDAGLLSGPSDNLAKELDSLISLMP